MKNSEITIRSRDVATLLDICLDDAVILAHKGILKAEKQGRVWAYNLQDVINYRNIEKKKKIKGRK